MIFWMRSHSRGLSGELRAKVDSSTGTLAIVVIAFVAVLREGLETALFLISAESGSTSGSTVVIGGIIGLGMSAVLGWLFYKGGNRVNLPTFFKYTGILLILFAAGLAGKALHEMHDFFELNGWLFSNAWTVTSGPFASGTLHDFLKGLFGWHPETEKIRHRAYIAYVVIVGRLFLQKQSAPAVTKAATPVGAVK
jgi:high-affinity iron transporter